MGVELGLSQEGKNTDWRCLRTGCWREYLDLRDRKRWMTGEDFITKSFIICTPHQNLLRWSNRGWCNR